MKDTADTATLDLFAPLPAAPPPLLPTLAPNERPTVEDCRRMRPIIGRLSRELPALLGEGEARGPKPTPTPAPVPAYLPAPFGPFQGADAVEWELARMEFGHAMKAAGRGEEILNYPHFVMAFPGRLDHKKLTRTCNELLGRPASDRPTPTTEDWRTVTVALQGNQNQ